MPSDVAERPPSRFKQLVEQLCKEYERERLETTILREEMRKLGKEVQQLPCNDLRERCIYESEGHPVAEEQRDVVIGERDALCLDVFDAVLHERLPVGYEMRVEMIPPSSKCFWKDGAGVPVGADDALTKAVPGCETDLAIDGAPKRSDDALRARFSPCGGDEPDVRSETSEQQVCAASDRLERVHSESGPVSSAADSMTTEACYYSNSIGVNDGEDSAHLRSLKHSETQKALYKSRTRSQTEDLVDAGHFAPRPIWNRKMSKRKQVTVGNLPSSERESNQSYMIQVAVHEEPAECFIYRAPSSWDRVAWDTIGLLSLALDLVLVPLQAFSIPRLESAHMLDWVTRIFWTIDIPASFFVGFYHQGDLIMSPRRICFHYLTTWFVPDITVVGCDWLFWWMSQSKGTTSGSYVRMARIARIARLVRLFRVLKLRRLLQGIEDLVDTEKVHIMLSCTKPVVLILTFNHFLACAWFSVGSVSHEGWTRAVTDRTVSYQYLTSLHWSLSQFTVGNMDVEPVNAGERLFTIIVMVTGLSAFSSLLGSVTSGVERLRELRSDENRQFWLLRRYLRDYKISKNLVSRIHRYCDYAYKHRQSKMQKQRVTLLELLSDHLHWELQSEIHAPHLKHHPLFDKIVNLPCKNHLDRVCAHALISVEVAHSEGLFRPGDPSDRMLFIMDGQCVYIKARNLEYGEMHAPFTPKPANHMPADFGLNTSHKPIGVGDWACEQVLYTPWVHLGELRAMLESRLLALDATQFGEVMASSNLVSWELCRTYAAAFLELMNELPAQDLTDILQGAFSPNEVIALQESQAPVLIRSSISLDSDNDESNDDAQPNWSMETLAGKLKESLPDLHLGSR